MSEGAWRPPRGWPFNPLLPETVPRARARSHPAVLPCCVQIALKPASNALGLHGVFIRGKGLKYLIADGAFKRLQVDAPGARWLDAGEHHLRLAPRTGRALNCSEGNDGRQALRLGHNVCLPRTGGRATLSVTGLPGRRSGDCLSMRLQGLKRELIRGYVQESRHHWRMWLYKGLPP